MTATQFFLLVRRSPDPTDQEAVVQMCERKREKFTESVRPSEISLPAGLGMAIISTDEAFALGVATDSGRNTTLQNRINYSSLKWWAKDDCPRVELPGGDTQPYTLLLSTEADTAVEKVRRLQDLFSGLRQHIKDILAILLGAPTVDLPRDIGQDRIDTLTMEGDGLNMALKIADIPEDITLNYRPPQDREFLHLLDGLSAYLDEDSVIAREAEHFFEAEGLLPQIATPRGFEFRGADAALAVVDVNRRGGERVLGTDMIIYDGRRNNAILVQYKMMDGSGDSCGYRPDHDRNIKGEIARWERWSEKFGRRSDRTNARAYRLCDIPYYFKLCPRRTHDSFSPSELIKGTILPLELFILLWEDKDLGKGKLGGKILGFQNTEKRYLWNSEFKDLFLKGWIGTSCNADLIWQIARASLENDKNVIAAFVV